MEVLLVSALAGWPGAIAAAAQEATADRGVPWVAFVILGLYLVVMIGVFLILAYRDRRPLVIRRLPFTVAYELERLAERERRSPAQQALLLIEGGLEAGERRGLVIRRLPFNVAYELERLAERERRSLDQQAVALMEEALEARERARYGRVGAYGARGGELKPAV